MESVLKSMKQVYKPEGSIIMELAKVYEKKNRLRNLILKITIALTCMIFFMLFSLTFGKLNVDKVKNVRENGMTISTYLENGTESNEEKIRKLNYVNEIGLEKVSGVLMKEGREYCTCAVLDKNAYENMMSPAYTDICGTYPQKANEIMMSRRSLEYIGINNPQIGMKIILDFHWFGMNDTNIGKQEFILSGYFQDYSNDLSGTSIAFIAKERLEESGIELYPLRILIDIETEYIKGSNVEELLYNDIFLTKSNQRFVSKDSAEYNAVENMLGGYGIASLLGIVVLLAMFLLTYNVFFISLNQDMKQYGLLRIVGATEKQIKQILYLQIIRIAFSSIIIGIICSALLAKFIIPRLIMIMYLGEVGSLENIHMFDFKILICSIIFTFLTLILSMQKIINKIMRFNPIKTFNYNNVDINIIKKKRAIKHRKRNRINKINAGFIQKIAFKNITRSKIKLIYTILSFVLGCVIALCGSMIAKGIDITNQISKNPDFEIGIRKEALRGFPYREEIMRVDKETIFDYTIFSDEMISLISENANIQFDEINQIYGCFAVIDGIDRSVYYKSSKEEQKILKKQSAFEPIYNIDTGVWIGTAAGHYGLGIIEVLKDEYVDKLVDYVEKYDVNADINTFLNDDGVLIFHENILNEESKRKIAASIGKSIWTYMVDVMYPGKYFHKDTGKLINCGYINVLDENFPVVEKTWVGDDVLYCMITERSFEKLSNLPKQIFHITFDVQEKNERKVKQSLRDWVREQNIQFRYEKEKEFDLFYLVSNSDILAEQESYIKGSRNVSFIISAVLLIIGIMNYFNTFVSEILSRRNEFALLQCIGMTKKQLFKVLVLEGVYYSSLMNVILLTVGNLIIYLLSLYMKNRISYFEFSYPWVNLLFMLIIISIICIGIPLILCLSMKKKNVIDYLNNNK